MESVRTGDCCKCTSALSCNAATPGSLLSLSEASCGCSCFTFLDTFFYFPLSVLQVIFLLLVCPDRTPFFYFCVLTAVMHIPWEKTPQQKNIEKHCSNVVLLLLSDRRSLKDDKEDRGRNVTGSSGKEDSRRAKHDLGNWSVEGSEGLWQQVSGGRVLLHWQHAQGWTAVATAVVGCAHVHRQSAELLGTSIPMKYWLCAFVSLPCCCASPLLCPLLHLPRAVRVVLSAGNRLWPSSFPMANSGFALHPAMCLCRLIRVNGINEGKNEIGLWIQTEMGQG